jgi:pimeloyl-ACP methyl ester carboxylesterase
MARAVRCYCMYGLGGPIWSGGIENVLAANLRKIKGVICPPTFRYGQWRLIADAIKNTPGDIHVVIGHSMGAAAATYVTDHVKVDLLVLYDLAGMSPSKLGKNTGKCIDIYDVIPDLVPEWRVQAVKGHEHKIERWTSTYGHTGQDDSEALMRRVGAEVMKLAA